ncbi:carbohydrate ABC transporter permease [Stackebrandtia nassauensis]|uniref:Binding-protein-dependent transport systems inner membrane component n=1 Tax=Stackebrandtia nassauensis (strain DSM 44728 / CIP 108903 / NRRL B-16338 / NBRC 102104 / LLR-40K-21) TaxID=446470 RepID=D3PYF8_STANL|nr:sugar ABC transporter permease [Stackebrandtia nassauensis]ADD41525.1 binding-protein-dependent transport systems inner membrane component [Stackebrandtia nassauensis DSM 44728]
MALYPLMWPLFAVTTLAGALVGMAAWRAAGLRGRTGALIVAPAGALGPLLTMVPLQSCTFEPGRTTMDFAVGTLAFAGGAAVTIALVTWVGRALSQPGGLSNLDGGEEAGAWRGRPIIPWVLLLPSLVILAIFLYWPLLETFRLSTLLTKRGARREVFKCVDNYTALLGPSLEWWLVVPVAALVVVSIAWFTAARLDPQGVGDATARLRRLRGWLLGISVVAAGAAVFGPQYRMVYVTTMILAGGTVIVGLLVGLGIALLVSQPIKGRGVYRTLLIWPFAISPPIAGILFFVMFDPSTGIIGYLYELLTPWQMQNFAEDATMARIVIIVTSVWKTLGFTILFYIAGLQNVSTSMLEAAKLDGANAWQRLRHFIIPSLTPITFFLIVTNVTYAFFQIFGTIDNMTRGGPSGATRDALTDVIRQAEGNIGAGAAGSLVLFAMVLAVTAWQFRVTGRRVHYGA